MRSTMAPETSAAVTIAKVAWKEKNASAGTLPRASRPTPRSKA
jgi:hypothetical protein